MKTVVGLFEELEDARDAVEDLVDMGIARDDISLVSRDVSGEYETYLETEHDGDEEVAEASAAGAVGGAVVGGLTGLLLGLGTLAIPGLGIVVAAGPIASALSGAVVGGVTGGFLNALVEWGIPEEEAEYYAEEVRRGGTLVAAKVPEHQVEDAMDALDDHDPVDVERRAEYWREEEGWAGYDAGAEPYGEDEITEYRSRYEDWDDESDDYYDVDDFEEFDDTFRRHYEAEYATTDYGYDRYVPAYRYGYDLATDPRYQDYSWADVESEAERRWQEERDEGAWEEFEEAVRHGWEQVKDAVGAGEYDFGVPDAEDEDAHSYA